MPKSLLLAAFLLTLCFHELFAQRVLVGNHHEYDQRILQSTRERDVDSLLEAIANQDNGNYLIATSRAPLSGRPYPYGLFWEIVRDERVRKIYQCLKGMPKDKAGPLVLESFQKTLRAVKQGDRSGPANYGLNAKLWLLMEFGEKSQFNKCFSDWYHWYVDVVSEHIAEFGSAKRPPKIGPDFLMYVNLVLIHHQRQSTLVDSPEFLQVISQLGCEPVVHHLMPLEGELQKPLTTIPVFEDATDFYSPKLGWRSRIVTKLRNQMENRGKLKNEIDQWIDSNLSIDQGFLWVYRLRNAQIASKGTKIQFFLTNGQQVTRTWGFYSRPPLKRALESAAKSMLKNQSAAERTKWEPLVCEFTEWLNSVPPEGIAVQKRKVFQWADRDQDFPKHPSAKPRKIRLIIAETNTLRDQETPEFIEKQKLLRKQLFESSRQPFDKPISQSDRTTNKTTNRDP